ncbi:hypothetical protein ACI6Q2_14005 [Chitinophagaceae bacterium LWZ2-11]
MQHNNPDQAALTQLLKENPLYIFALEAEAIGEFDNVHPFFIGIGKVNAAFHLTKRIITNKPSIIVNLGSAGSNKFKRGEVVCCTRFIQRDMDVTPLGFAKYETPFSGQEAIVSYGIKVDGLQEGTCGSGDNFEVGHVSSDYDVIDMEAFPLAWIARQENIPFVCLKYISDGADGQAAEDWSVEVHNAAVALRKVVDKL